MFTKVSRIRYPIDTQSLPRKRTNYKPSTSKQQMFSVPFQFTKYLQQELPCDLWMCPATRLVCDIVELYTLPRPEIIGIQKLHQQHLQPSGIYCRLYDAGSSTDRTRIGAKLRICQAPFTWGKSTCGSLQQLIINPVKNRILPRKRVCKRGSALCHQIEMLWCQIHWVQMWWIIPHHETQIVIDRGILKILGVAYHGMEVTLRGWQEICIVHE